MTRFVLAAWGQVGRAHRINVHVKFPGFSVPPYAPPNYVPLVWSDFGEGRITLLKLPVITDK